MVVVGFVVVGVLVADVEEGVGVGFLVVHGFLVVAHGEGGLEGGMLVRHWRGVGGLEEVGIVESVVRAVSMAEVAIEFVGELAWWKERELSRWVCWTWLLFVMRPVEALKTFWVARIG